MSIGIAEVGVMVIGLVPLFLAIIAFVGIFKSTNLSSTGKAAWVLIVLFFPVAGPLVWLVWGKDDANSKPSRME